MTDRPRLPPPNPPHPLAVWLFSHGYTREHLAHVLGISTRLLADMSAGRLAMPSDIAAEIEALSDGAVRKRDWANLGPARPREVIDLHDLDEFVVEAANLPSGRNVAVLLLVEVGLRPAEALAVHIEDLDLANHTVSIRRLLTNSKEVLPLPQDKQRCEQLVGFVAGTIPEYLERRGNPKSGLLLVNKHGGPMDKGNLSRDCRRCGEILDLPVRTTPRVIHRTHLWHVGLAVELQERRSAQAGEAQVPESSEPRV